MKDLQKMKNNTQKGFTLIELMIVVAIIGILAAVAIPQYREYTRNTTAQSTLTEAGAYKLAVSLCIQTNGGVVTGCNAASNRIPAAAGIVTGITNGVISINLGDIDGDGTNETVINTPVASATLVTWTITSAGGTDPCGVWIECTT